MQPGFAVLVLFIHTCGRRLVDSWDAVMLDTGSTNRIVAIKSIQTAQVLWQSVITRVHKYGHSRRMHNSCVRVCDMHFAVYTFA